MPTIDWNRSWAKNLIHHMRGGLPGEFYGDQWGDPEQREDLITVRKRFLTPFIRSDQVALEIGSGGGRWTQYLFPFREVICVEMNPEMFGYLRDRFENPAHFQYITTHGSDIPFIPADYVDFAFSFGVFVHLDLDLIENYMTELRRIMKPGAQFVVQFSNKNKPSAASNPDFSENTPERMMDLLSSAGFESVDIDDDTMAHSSIIRAIKL